MDLILQYDDDNDDGNDSKAPSLSSSSSSSSSSFRSSSSSSSLALPRGVSSSTRTVVNIAPEVDLHLHELEASSGYVSPATKQLYHNPTAAQLWQPVIGPANPFSKHNASKNIVTGFVEPAAFDEAIFHDQFHTFTTYGYAMDPSLIGTVAASTDASFVGNLSNAVANKGNTLFTRTKDSRARTIPTHSTGGSSSSSTSRSTSSSASSSTSASSSASSSTSSSAATTAIEEVDSDEKVAVVDDVDAPETSSSSSSLVVSEPAKKKKRGHMGDAAVVGGYTGTWGPLPGEIRVQTDLTEDQKKYIAEQQTKKKPKPDRDAPDETSESTTFHGKEEKDYQGRSYMYFGGNKAAAEKNFIPKTAIHTFRGHTKGVNAIRFLPRTAHLLLSASMDTNIKIWGVSGENRRCLRTYAGHSQSVRDICFNHDGSRFISASYDKYIKLWDTETGQCISRHTTKRVPYCVKLHPDPGREHQCLVGQNDKKIVQWDLKSDHVTLEYDEHLSAVNTCTFIDDNRRFVSTSDDKKVFIWEYGIPVVIKHIAEPDMHSMPFVETHPSKKWFCGQSQDNQILVYSTMRGFKLNKKKRFLGHFNAGYAAQISFSPDGRFITSGDGEGRCFFWNWSTCQPIKKLQAHDGSVCIGATWHPLETSRLATCGWDGLIKLWD